MLLFHAAAFGGVSASGQYSSGHFGETYFLLRLNSRMSHCAIRMCSRIIHEECGKFSGLRPQSSSGRFLMTSSNLACAPPPGNQVSKILAQMLLVIFRQEPSATPV